MTRHLDRRLSRPLLPFRPLAAVALANKVARIAWAMLAKGEDYRAPTAASAAA